MEAEAPATHPGHLSPRCRLVRAAIRAELEKGPVFTRDLMRKIGTRWDVINRWAPLAGAMYVERVTDRGVSRVHYLRPEERPAAQDMLQRRTKVSVQKGWRKVAILALFAVRPMKRSHVAHTLGLCENAAWRTTGVLADAGWVEAQGGVYSLTPKGEEVLAALLRDPPHKALATMVELGPPRDIEAVREGYPKEQWALAWAAAHYVAPAAKAPPKNIPIVYGRAPSASTAKARALVLEKAVGVKGPDGLVWTLVPTLADPGAWEIVEAQDVSHHRILGYTTAKARLERFLAAGPLSRLGSVYHHGGRLVSVAPAPCWPGFWTLPEVAPGRRWGSEAEAQEALRGMIGPLKKTAAPKKDKP
jgi:hypothetical protein